MACLSHLNFKDAYSIIGNLRLDLDPKCAQSSQQNTTNGLDIYANCSDHEYALNRPTSRTMYISKWGPLTPLLFSKCRIIQYLQLSYVLLSCKLQNIIGKSYQLSKVVMHNTKIENVNIKNCIDNRHALCTKSCHECHLYTKLEKTFALGHIIP